MSDIDPAWCLERFLSSCFPGKGKKRSIVPTHTPRRSSSRPDGCCVFWSDSSQTETASLKRFDDRRRIEQRNDLFVQKRGHWDSLLHFHTGTHCRTLEVMQGVLCLAQWHCGSNDCSHLYFRCLRFLKLHQTPKLFNKPEYISLISQFYFRFWSPTTPEGNMWLCCCWRQGFHNKTQFPVSSWKRFQLVWCLNPLCRRDDGRQLTCTRGGLQRRFFSGAAAKPADIPAGLFFTTRTTPPDSALSFSTRCFNCQPTWTNHRRKLWRWRF